MPGGGIVMKKFLFLTLAITSLSHAAPVVKTWVNPDCASGSCELKGMKLFTEKYNTKFAGTDMAAEIETTDKSALAKYAFVQYIEGCIFETNREGKVRMAQREFWKRKGQPFKHVGFELDSASDKDPIYWSNSIAGFDELRGFFIPRNSFYANANPIVTENFGAWAGKEKNVKESKIYVSDAPTPATWTTDENLRVVARNSSLRFKMCVHRIEDVPATVESPATQIENPIVCMDWNSNFIYNFATRKFEDKGDVIHPACK